MSHKIRIVLIKAIPRHFWHEGASGVYLIESRMIVVGMHHTARATHLELGPNMVLISAHEAAHAAQHARDGNIVPSDPSTYDDDPREHEAWRVAARVFKSIYPSAAGHIQAGRAEYPIP